jgi:hypothetical protein
MLTLYPPGTTLHPGTFVLLADDPELWIVAREARGTAELQRPHSDNIRKVISERCRRVNLGLSTFVDGVIDQSETQTL